VLRPDSARHLRAEMRGNLPGLLRLDDGGLASVGAGRGISSLPNIGGVLDVP